MTPVTIVGTAKLLGLDFVAIADHNAIAHVPVALAAGEAYGVNVVPAIELQTEEDIHILCLFKTYEHLKSFFGEIEFSQRKNRADVFGRQLVFDEDDNVVAEEERMLLDSAKISSDDVPSLVAKYDGVAIPAHIDRDANSMLNILGAITDGYRTVELSTRADDEQIAKWSKTHTVIVDSDSHMLDTISAKGEIELDDGTVSAFVDRLAVSYERRSK